MLVEAYYESGNAPHEALGRAARRLSDGGALYIGGGVGVEKVKKGDAETFAVTQGTGKAESFAGPLSAVVRAFTIAGGATAIDSPGGTSAVTDPAAAARLRELTDEEASTKRDLDRYTRQLARKAAAQSSGKIPWSPSSIGSDDAWEARRIEELKADLASIAAERSKLIAAGKVEEVEQARPGTNFTKIPPKNVKRLSSIIDHYRGMAHPFSTCVRDQIKHGLSEDHANRRCAVVKDLAMGTTKWRKGGKPASKMAERLLVEALGRLDVVIGEYGLAATVHLAEGMDSALPSVHALAEGVSNDFGLLSLAGHPLALAVFGVTENPVRGALMSLLNDLLDARRTAPAEPVEEAFNTALHPHALHGPHGGQFIKTLGAHRSPGGGRTKIPEGSGPSNPTAKVAGRAPKLGKLDVAGRPRAPGADSPAPANRRKLTPKELVKAVGRGPWSRGAKKATADILAGKVDDTEHAHREVNPDGSLGFYSPDRIALHQQIVKALLQGAGSHPGEKRAVFLAGGPASGKSTLVRSGAVKLPVDFVDINPDIVRTMLPEYAPLIAAGEKAASSKTHEEASHISKMAMNLAMLRDHHVVVDGVGNSGPGKFANKIRAALEHGYDVSVVYATIDTEEAVRRATARAENPKSDSYGRNVPTGYLRSSHRDVTVRFRDDVSKMKGVHVQVFDTSNKRPRLVAEVGTGGELRVKSRKLFKAFMGKAGDGDA